MQDAIRVISQIATGRNPFSDEPFEKLRPEQRDTVLQALCVVIASLADGPEMKPPKPATPSVPREDTEPFAVGTPLDDYLERVERAAIVRALAETGNNRTAAARLLGITFRAMRYKMESLGIEQGSE